MSRAVHDSKRLRAVQELRTRGSHDELSSLALKLAEEADQLEQKALIDSLTGVWNRGAIMELAARELQLGVTRRTSTGILLLDIDHFKQINDNYGHQVGDDVLCRVAKVISRGIRPGDSVGRYGGEEFLVVLPSCSGSDVSAVGDRVREDLVRTPMTLEGKKIPVTMSVGCTVSVDGAHFTDLLVKAADMALYRAKADGRNCTRMKPLTPSVLSMKAIKR